MTTKPPIAKVDPHFTEIHGRTLRDDYFWLRNKTSPEVLAYIEAENKYSQEWLSHHKELEDQIYADIVSMIREDDESPPYPLGTHLYGNTIQKGQQYPVLCRAKASTPHDKEIIFDQNQEAAGFDYFELGAMSISRSESLMAYSRDTVGFRQYELFVKDLKSGAVSAPIAQSVGSIEWTSDSKSLLYAIEDQSKRKYRIMHHVLGTDSSLDKVIFEEKDERFSVHVSTSRNREWIFIHTDSHTTSEVHFAPADLSTPFRVILPRKQDVEYGVDARDEYFYIHLNDQSPNKRLAKIKISATGDESKLQNFFDPAPEVSLTDFDVFKDYLVITQSTGGLEQFVVYTFADSTAQTLKFPEPTYSLESGRNFIFDTAKFRFHYSSLVTPSTVFLADLKSLELEVLKESTPPGGYDKNQYHTERVMTTVRDGTKVPVSLVYKKSLYQPGKNASLLYGYGAYGIPIEAGFRASIFALLDRGVVFAKIHVRGGGEFGKSWHDAGKMQNKKNSFTDFIDATRALIDLKHIAADKIFAEGGSAGGLLMGAVVNLEPALYRGIITQVPFFDVINTMLDESLPLTVGEFEEWGNPKVPEDFERMISYSPYDNLKPGAYPAMWIRSGFHDSQVMYWEPAKYMAKLRQLKTNDSPAFLSIDMSSGHGGASGRYNVYREVAQDYVFLLATVTSA